MIPDTFKNTSVNASSSACSLDPLFDSCLFARHPSVHTTPQMTPILFNYSYASRGKKGKHLNATEHSSVLLDHSYDQRHESADIDCSSDSIVVHMPHEPLLRMCEQIVPNSNFDSFAALAALIKVFKRPIPPYSMNRFFR